MRRSCHRHPLACALSERLVGSGRATGRRHATRLAVVLAATAALTACTGPAPTASTDASTALVATAAPTRDAPTRDASRRPARPERTTSGESSTERVLPGRAAPAPEQPAAMAVGDSTGALAAVEHVLVLWTHARTTGSVAALEGTYADTCGICVEVAERVVTLAASGITEVDGGLTLVDPATTEAVPGSWYAVTAVLVEDDAQLVDADGAAVGGVIDGGRYDMLATLSWYEGTWRVESMTLYATTS
ncbi:DUF6318 family protein [Cellulomonas algicola]|nr:DUF6318 family protein [Cellulomonas algicola]